MVRVDLGDSFVEIDQADHPHVEFGRRKSSVPTEPNLPYRVLDVPGGELVPLTNSEQRESFREFYKNIY